MNLTSKEEQKIQEDREIHQKIAVNEIKKFEDFLKRPLTISEKKEILESDQPHYVKDKSFYWEFTAKYLMQTATKPKLTFWQKIMKTLNK